MHWVGWTGGEKEHVLMYIVYICITGCVCGATRVANTNSFSYTLYAYAYI